MSERTYPQRAGDGSVYYLGESDIDSATVAELQYLTYPARITAKVGAMDEATDRVQADLADDSIQIDWTEIARQNEAAARTYAARRTQALGGGVQAERQLVPVAVAERLHEDRHDYWIAGRVIAAVLAVIALLALGIATPSPAHALAVPMQRTPLTLVVSGPTTPVRLTAATTTGSYVALWSPTGPVAFGSAAGGMADVRGSIASKRLTAGRQGMGWELVDGTEPVTPITVDVLRQSRVTAEPAVGFPGGFAIAGRATHYDITTGAYSGDKASQVLVQIAYGTGAWRTAQTVNTAADGSVVAVVKAPAGRVQIRLVRQRGATVTGATSAVRTATVAKAPKSGWTGEL